MERRPYVDLTESPFPEYFLSITCRDGKLSYKTKCFVLSITLYLIGVIAAFKSGTLWEFLSGMTFVAILIVYSITLIVLTSFFKKIDDSIMKLELVICSDEEKLRDFFYNAKKGKDIYFASMFWYYFTGITFGFLGFLVSYFIVLREQALLPPWLMTSEQGVQIYFLAFWTFISFIAGCLWNKIIVGIMILKRYCKDFIKAEKITPLNPDKTGGLYPLGNISLELDIALAIPSLLIVIYLMSGIPLTNRVVMGLIFIYTVGLAIVFFFPLNPAHDVMLEAKERELARIDSEFRNIYKKISPQKEYIDLQQCEELKNIYLLHDRARKMVVWPLDISLIFKYVFTVLFPIMSGVTAEFMLTNILK